MMQYLKPYLILKACFDLLTPVMVVVAAVLVVWGWDTAFCGSFPVTPASLGQCHMEDL